MTDDASPVGLLGRLAPVAFAAGLVLLGLGLFIVVFAMTGPDPGPIEYHEDFVVNGTAYSAYPIGLSGRADLRLNVVFRFPTEGMAFLTGCQDYEAIKAGREPLSPDMRTGGSYGRQGRFSTGLPADAYDREPSRLAGDAGCPFAYVVFAWDPAGDPEATRPEVEITVSSFLLSGPVGALAILVSLLGATLATTGGIAWGRRLNRRVRAAPGLVEEGTAETLLRIVERSGDWLERTRRYLIFAGVLGIFVWYPVLLPWAWKTAIRGTREQWLPWALAGGALVLLFALTIVWTREYLRLDRELVAWRERVGRLRRREAALLAGDEAG